MRRKDDVTFFLFILLLAITSSSPAAPAEMSFEHLCESEILRRVNFERSRQLPPPPALQRDTGLNQSAQAHAEDMVQRNYVDHVSPDGVTPHERITRSHRYLLISSTGENLWMREWDGRGESPESVARRMMEDWMASPYHRANILNTAFTHLGIHVRRAGDRIYAVQHFAGSRGTLEPPLPERIQRGDTLMLNVTTRDPDVANPRKFDLIDPDTFQPVCEPTYLRTGHLEAPAGRFCIRLFFLSPGEKRWEVYTGPMITVP
ncbi:MAG TPA: CAP domain-containing protein [bacterium]|nr:CAP domain-containing protein [bacterium]